MNKKYIIILGALFLLLIISTGLITYYKGKEMQIQRPFDESEDFIIVPLDYPSSFKELSSFIKILKNAVLLDREELKGAEGIRAAGSYITEKTSLLDLDVIQSYFDDEYISYTPDLMTLSASLESIPVLKANKYFGISLNTQDIIQADSNSLLSEENVLHFCTISEPALEDPLLKQIESENDFWFSQGSISCMEVNPNEEHAMIFVGFVPQAELISIKLYLVDDFTILDIRNAQSFLETKEIIDDYNILWQMEKPINL